MPELEKPRSLEKEILGKSMIYSFSLYVRMFVKLLSGIFIAKLLGPSLFGLKNAYDLVMEYESNSDLGTFDALNRLAPYHRGARQEDKAQTSINSVFSINVSYALFAAAALMAVSLYLRYAGFAQVYVDFAFFLGIMVFTRKLYLFLNTKLKIDHRFYELSFNQLLYGLTASVLGVVFTWFWSFRGLLAALVTADLVCIGHLVFLEKRLPQMRFCLHSYWQVLKVGFPMMILFLLIMLLTNLDRTLILAMISEKALGYFGIATVAAAVVLTIPAAVHSVTLAPVMEKLGRTGDFLTIKNYLSEPMFVMAYILPVFIACIFFAIHLPIRYFLDQYLPSIPVVKILVAGAYFESVAFPVLSVCLALNRQIQLIFMVIPMVGLNFVLNYAVIRAGWGINGVAAATGTTFFITFCVLLFYASVQFGERPGIYLKNLAAILAPFVFSCALIFCIETFAAFPADSLGFDIVIVMFKIFVFMIVYSVLLYFTRRHSGFIKLYANLCILAGNLLPGKSERK